MSDSLRQMQIDRLTDEMLRWVAGERSHQNEFSHLGLGVVAILDAQKVVGLSAAIQALAAVERINKREQSEKDE